MKKYFAKYLPIISEDRKPFSDTSREWAPMDIALDGEGQHSVIQIFNGKTYTRKAQLFLCSYDVQIGDIFKFFGSDSNMFERRWEERYRETENNPFKIIAEISPEASWVNEADEFDEDEVQFIVFPDEEEKEDWVKETGSNKVMLHYYSSLVPSNSKFIIDAQIKNPTCKHFH